MTCASFSANTDANHSISGVTRRVPPQSSRPIDSSDPPWPRSGIAWNALFSNGVAGRRRRSIAAPVPTAG